MTTRLDDLWQLLDRQVAAGRMPGYVAALRIRGEPVVRAGGRTAVADGSPPMREDTLFRIASLTKPMAGALALALMADGVLALDDPVERRLPELAGVPVLEDPHGPLDRTVPLERPVTVRHLLTMTSGWGVAFADSPLRDAMRERGLHPGPMPRGISHDEYIARLAGLPLAFQPGDGFRYDTGTDVLGVLLARATGRSVGELVAERIAGPLGMTDAAFWAREPARLATAFTPTDDGLAVLDPPDGAFTHPPVFESLSGGVVATAPDVLRFFVAMADGGAPVLTRDAVAAMTADQLTPQQRASGADFVGPGGSWGLATGVEVEATEAGSTPGRWGWTGGTGTVAFVDPTRDVVAVLLTQRAMAGPQDGFGDFMQAVSAAASRSR